MILLDTCILVDYTRRKPEVVDYINRVGKQNLYLNSIIVMEMLRGAINKEDLKQIKIDLQDFLLLPVNQQVMGLATRLIETYKLSHDAKIPDMIIAATALVFDLEIMTYNIRDFRFLPGLSVNTQLTV